MLPIGKHTARNCFKEKELLLTTLRSIGDGVVTTDGSGRITSLNIAAQQITGWKDEEVKGRQFADVFKLLNEETWEQIDSPIKKCLTQVILWSLQII